MKSLFIPVHSFVDVITNSSSEVFVSADENTVKAVKELINNLLAGVGAKETCDDLFDVTMSIDVDNPKPYNERAPGESYNLTVPVDSELGKQGIEDQQGSHGDMGPEYGVLVTAKPGTDERLRKAAATLSNLSGLFEYEAYYS